MNKKITISKNLQKIEICLQLLLMRMRNYITDIVYNAVYKYHIMNIIF